MKRTHLYSQLSSNIEAFELAKRLGLINLTEKRCPKCSGILKISLGKNRHAIDGFFKCNNKNTCRYSCSIYTNSIFKNMHVSFCQFFEIAYLYREKKSIAESAIEIGVSKKNVGIWFLKFKNLLYTFAKRKNELLVLGGENETVEVDECHIFTRKNDVGRVLRGQSYWCVGAKCRRSKNVKLQILRVRNERNLTEFITRNILNRTTIITDGWRGYANLVRNNFIHKVVVHSENFVDPEDSTIHTNGIERVWRSLREFLPKNQRFENIEKNVEIFVLENNRDRKSVV